MEPGEPFPLVHAGVVAGHQVDQHRPQVAEVGPEPVWPAPQRLHRRPVAGRGGHEPPDLAADGAQQLPVGRVGGVQVLADLKVDGAEAVGPQEAQPPLDLGRSEVAGVVPLVDGQARRHAHLPVPRVRLVSGGAAHGRAADREHDGQDQDGGCPAHGLPPRWDRCQRVPIGRRAPEVEARLPTPGQTPAGVRSSSSSAAGGAWVLWRMPLRCILPHCPRLNGTCTVATVRSRARNWR